MKRLTICIVAALAAALAVCAIAGCSSQSASSASSASAASSASSASSAQSQEEITAELKNAIANEPEFKSVTVTQTTEAIFKADTESATSESSAAASESAAASSEAASSEAASSEAASSAAASSEAASNAAADEASANVIASKAVYQFDASGDELKTKVTATMEDIVVEYYSVGDKAVCVTDGPIYSGTTEQFAEPHFGGFEAFLAKEIGDVNTLIDCADTVTKDEIDGATVYALTLNPEKYIASDEILTMMAEYGDPVLNANISFAFDKEGHMVSYHQYVEYQASSNESTLEFSDFDSTVIDPMPEADKTYEEMEQDIQSKLDEFDKMLEDDAQSAESADAAEAK